MVFDRWRQSSRPTDDAKPEGCEENRPTARFSSVTYRLSMLPRPALAGGAYQIETPLYQRLSVTVLVTRAKLKETRITVVSNSSKKLS